MGGVCFVFIHLCVFQDPRIQSKIWIYSFLQKADSPPPHPPPSCLLRHIYGYLGSLSECDKIVVK